MKGNYWSIHELVIFGAKPTAKVASVRRSRAARFDQLRFRKTKRPAFSREKAGRSLNRFPADQITAVLPGIARW